MFVLCFGFVIEFVVGFAVCRWFGLLECVLLVACCMAVVVMVSFTGFIVRGLPFG